MNILLTNNPACQAHFEGFYQVEFFEGTPLEVLQKVRAYVHLGHGLISHPMAGGLPPGTTPYKSVIISAEAGAISTENIGIIENATERYTRHGDFYPTSHLESHQTLDLALLRR